MRSMWEIPVDTIGISFQGISEPISGTNGFERNCGLMNIETDKRGELETTHSGLFPASSALYSIVSCIVFHDIRHVRSQSNTDYTQKHNINIYKPLQGSTLIEILVVISIISLLLLISLSALRSARHLAQRVRCSSNLKALTFAVLMYAGDNNENLLVKDIGMNPYQLNLAHQREINKGHPDLRDMFNGYLLGFDKNDGASPHMFCPSARPQLDQCRRQISYELASTRWDKGDYVIGYPYWAAIEENLDAIGLDWFSEVDPVYRTTVRAYTPLFSDPLEKHHFSPSPHQWGLASHTREGTTENTSARPAGQNNARLDGSVTFLKFAENHDWADDFNRFGDLEAATCVLGREDILLLWGGAR
ncbi:MAG: prepilin-type N-terminal cleavage/methylation domain-containing protein [Candidatus Hodarchaeota archaeon]